MEGALPLVRAALYLCVSGLFGSALTVALWPTELARPAQRRWISACAVGCAGLSVCGLWLQVSVMNGESPTPAMVASVVPELAVGRATLVRVLAATAAASLLIGWGAGRRKLLAAATLGAAAAASLAWGGHGAASGPVWLAVDLVHLLASAFWIGAVAALLLEAAGARAKQPSTVGRLASALAAFSGPGTMAVAALAFTGLANAWRLIGPAHVSALWSQPYGRLLSLKLALFGVMLACAAANRWRHAAALSDVVEPAPAAALRAARASLALELVAGVGVLASVGWLGTLAPPAEL